MWNKKQCKKFKIPYYSKEYIRKPLILKLLGNIKNKKIIEFGCGSGYWTRVFQKKEAICTGIDNSIEQINIAKDQEKENPHGINYIKEDITNIKSIKPNQFDIVFIDYVLLEMPKKSLVDKLFKEAFRMLKKKGIIFISDMHPFDPLMHNCFKLPKNFNYFKSGIKMITNARLIDGSIINFNDYHWTLEDYFSSITKAGFHISMLKEPIPSKDLIKKLPVFKYRESIPKDLFIIAKK